MDRFSILVCPSCRTPLDNRESHYACGSCSATYSSWLGIVSLITKHGAEPDATTRKLIDAFPTSTFDELLQLRTTVFSTTDPKLLERYRAYRRNMLARGQAFYEMARSVAQTRDTHIGQQCGIALGCGVGASMVCMARDFASVIGVDPSLPDLILAKKACEEFGITNVTLAHCFGENMPVPDEQVDLILAENVLEHVPELASVLGEVRRVLKPGATFVGDCANRYNMLRPEPHVQLWGVGLLPRKWQAPYVMWRRQFAGYDKSVHLKSYWQLRREMTRRLGAESTIEFPKAVTFGFSKRIDDVLSVINRLPPLRVMLLVIFPVFIAVGRRSRA